jgi:hypothetical protein
MKLVDVLDLSWWISFIFAVFQGDGQGLGGLVKGDSHLQSHVTLVWDVVGADMLEIVRRYAVGYRTGNNASKIVYTKGIEGLREPEARFSPGIVAGGQGCSEVKEGGIAG